MNFYLKELKSNGCYCGKTKKPFMAFCYRCYKLLPREIAGRLYKRLGQGYEKAYNDAINYLSD